MHPYVDVVRCKVVGGSDLEGPIQDWRGDSALGNDFNDTVFPLVPGRLDGMVLCQVQMAVAPVSAKIATAVIVGLCAVDVEAKGLGEYIWGKTF
jgi:hypothetical protein